MGALHHFEGKDGREMPLYLVNQTGNVRVPNADLVVEPRTKQQYHSFIEGQAQNAPSMLLINPFLLGVNSIPEDELAIHSSRSHELQFGHGDHAGDQHIDFFFTLILISTSGLGQHFFQISLEVPHADASTLLPTVEYLIDGIPGEAVDFSGEVMLEGFFLVVGLCGQHDAILSVFPPSDIPVTGRYEQELIFFIRQVEHVQHSYTSWQHQIFLSNRHLP